jgi:putative kinase
MGCYTLLINGFEIQAAFAEEAVSGILLPLLSKLTEMQRRKKSRLIVYLAAPPACGKSTLAAFLEMLSLQNSALEPVQPLGIDGFHYHQAYVLAHTVNRGGVETPMKDVKGCPESYDIEKLIVAMQGIMNQDIQWPFYDRRLHDVVEDAIVVNRKIVLIEGNWLLLNEGKWPVLRNFCNYSLMLHVEESILESRLIERKIRGGLSPKEAARFYTNSDRPNVLRCMDNSACADMTLRLLADGTMALL